MTFQRVISGHPTVRKEEDSCRCGTGGVFFYDDKWFCNDCVIKLMKDLRGGETCQR